MATSNPQITVEIAVDPAGDALAAYAALQLDRATGLRLDHATGALVAVLGGPKSQVACGNVSTRMATRLRGLSSIIWARLEGDETVAVSEIALEHV